MTVRPASPDDAAAIAWIYSAGIAERIATFETEPRTAEDVRPWFENSLPRIVVEIDGQVIAYAAAFPYSDRCCYGGVAEFSVYVAPETRRMGAGRLAMIGLIDAARGAGLHKLISRVFPENVPSLSLLRSLGFREVGVHEKHGKLDGHWRDVIAVERLIPENL